MIIKSHASFTFLYKKQNKKETVIVFSKWGFIGIKLCFIEWHRVNVTYFLQLKTLHWTVLIFYLLHWIAWVPSFIDCWVVTVSLMFCQLRYSGTAHMILQNMNQSVDPCDDFYQVFSIDLSQSHQSHSFQFACGGFEERVVIPDDRSSRSQFAIIGLTVGVVLGVLITFSSCRWRTPPAAQAHPGGRAWARGVQGVHHGQKCLQSLHGPG